MKRNITYFKSIIDFPYLKVVCLASNNNLRITEVLRVHSKIVEISQLIKPIKS